MHKSALALRRIALGWAIPFFIALPTRVDAAPGFSPSGRIAEPVLLAGELARLRALRGCIPLADGTQEKLTPLGSQFFQHAATDFRMPALTSLGAKDARESALTNVYRLVETFAGLDESSLWKSPPKTPNSTTQPRGDSSAPPSRGLPYNESKAASAGSGGLAGLPSETKVLVGLADFIGERAKEELVQSFLVDLDHKLDPRVERLMPASSLMLSQVKSTGYRALVPALTSAFHSDIAELPGRLADSVATASESSEVFIAITFRLCHDIGSGASPAIALRALLGPQSEKVNDSNVRFVLRLAGSFARDYAAHRHDSTPWYRAPELLPDYLAALVLQIGDLTNGDATADLLLRLQTQVDTPQEFAQALDELQTSLASKTSSGPSLDSVLLSTETLLGELAPLCGETNCSAATKWRDQLHDARAFECAISAHAWSDAIALILEKLPKDLREGPTIRYLIFASNLSAANDADGVRSALETLAEPVGAFRAKRDPLDGLGPRLTITVNSYVGPAVGVEWRRDGGTVDHGTASYPFTAQVGPEACVRTGCPTLSSVSLFFPILDLGNLVAYRAGGKEALGGSPQLGFRQVTAPGVFAVFGITRDRPISIGVGYQISPRLRRDLTTSRDVDVQRFSAFVGLDLPVVHF